MAMVMRFCSFGVKSGFSSFLAAAEDWASDAAGVPSLDAIFAGWWVDVVSG